MIEEWRPVVGHEDRYEVSNMGRVRSKNKILKQHAHYKSGHLRVRISTKIIETHTLVACAFLGPCPDGFECRHLDGNEADARLDNLAWGTRSQNMKDRKFHKGRPNAKKKWVTAAEVLRIRELLAAGVTGRAIAKEIGTNVMTVSQIKTGQAFKDV